MPSSPPQPVGRRSGSAADRTAPAAPAGAVRAGRAARRPPGPPPPCRRRTTARRPIISLRKTDPMARPTDKPPAKAGRLQTPMDRRPGDIQIPVPRTLPTRHRARKFQRTQHRRRPPTRPARLIPMQMQFRLPAAITATTRHRRPTVRMAHPPTHVPPGIIPPAIIALPTTHTRPAPLRPSKRLPTDTPRPQAIRPMPVARHRLARLRPSGISPVTRDIRRAARATRRQGCPPIRCRLSRTWFQPQGAEIPITVRAGQATMFQEAERELPRRLARMCRQRRQPTAMERRPPIRIRRLLARQPLGINPPPAINRPRIRTVDSKPGYS